MVSAPNHVTDTVHPCVSMGPMEPGSDSDDTPSRASTHIERPYFHIITPGDHFSPNTGSAIPTVVHGLSGAGTATSTPAVVVVGSSTDKERYTSAAVVEYEQMEHPRAWQRYIGAATGRIGLGRAYASREWSAAVAAQNEWPPSFVIAHNGVQLIPSINPSRHRSVLYAHNDLLQTYTRRETERTLRSLSAVICVSSSLAETTRRRLPKSLRNLVRVVPNGVNTDVFYPRPSPGRDATLRVIYLGRTMPQKGADILVKAALKLNRPDISYRVVGSYGFDPNAQLSDYDRELRRLARPLGARIEFEPTALRPQVPDILRAADLMVVPSRWDEPFGLTVLEGMATGIPVIGSAVGGIPQAMGSAGIQIPPDDPAALADAVAHLADNETHRMRLGADCRRYAEAHDWHWARAQLDRALQDLH